MMTPAIEALSRHFETKIDLILDDSFTDSRRPAVEEFCNHWPTINEVISFQKTFNIDRYTQLFYSNHGESSEAFTFFKNNAGIEGSHINWRQEKLHEVDFYMNDVFNLGYRGEVPKQYCIEPQVVEDDKRIQGDQIKIGFCNGFFAGSKWLWERKGWSYYYDLIKLLERFFGKENIRVLIFGKGEVEKRWGDGFGHEDHVVRLVDRLSIAGVVDYMNTLDLFITTDTGLMHIADALEIPTIALFGPTIVSKNGPYNKEHMIARSPLRCAPCQTTHMFYSCKEWRCMKELTPGMVFSLVRKYIENLITRGKIEKEKASQVVGYDFS